jgi:hypothetical protein
MVQVGDSISIYTPFTATQGLVGFCVILVLLVAAPSALLTKRKRSTVN